MQPGRGRGRGPMGRAGTRAGLCALRWQHAARQLSPPPHPHPSTHPLPPTHPPSLPPALAGCWLAHRVSHLHVCDLVLVHLAPAVQAVHADAVKGAGGAHARGGVDLPAQPAGRGGGGGAGDRRGEGPADGGRGARQHSEAEHSSRAACTQLKPASPPPSRPAAPCRLAGCLRLGGRLT